MKKILGKIFSRYFMFVFLLLVQIFFFCFSIWKLGNRYYLVYAGILILDIILIVYITNQNDNPSYKLAWIIAIDILPLFGGLAYVFVQTQIGKIIFTKRQNSSIDYSKNFLLQNQDIISELEIQSPSTANLAKYINKYGPFPIYKRTCVRYFSVGELQFEALVQELKKAESFIFMEFFIISEGYMFDTISEILIDKAKHGVEIRFMYDGIGTQLNMPSKAFDKLKENGVKCRIFNRFTPFLSSIQNNRDHRKIVVIDGHTAFTGGTNLADEYINRIERFGHWKDTAIMLRGDAVWNYTVMFLQLWELYEPKISDYETFIPKYRTICDFESDGFVQPYSDSPLDKENVGKMVYLDIINNAKKYVYITTPYLILDNEMLTALQLAAKKGIDVRIITPHIPDKWYVYMIAWTYYPLLIEAGVKIFEYTPGFIHAKSFVSDDARAVIGTINLDYRSLYLHYECACLLYQSSVVADIKDDFLETQTLSQQISMDDCKKLPLRKKIAGWLLNIFAPML